MKKTIQVIAFLAMGAALLVSCGKEEKLSSRTIRATMEQGEGKTYLDLNGLGIKWESSEAIYVSNGAWGTEYTLQSGANTTSGEFACGEGEEVYGDLMHAFYPTDLCQSFNNGVPQVNISNTQNYDATKHLVGFPMYAHFNANNASEVHFKNLCGVLKITMQKADTKIASINIATDRQIAGILPVKDTVENTTTGDTVYKVNAGAESTNNASVTLQCPKTGIDIAQATDFYIYLPAGEYEVFRITVSTTDGERCIFRTTDAIPTVRIQRNKIHTLSFSDEDLDFKIGLFSVSSSKKVYFAPGNVYYNTQTQSWGIFQDQTERYCNGVDLSTVNAASAVAPGGAPTTVAANCKYIDYFRQGLGSWSIDPSQSMGVTANLTIAYGDYGAPGTGTDWGSLFPGEGWYTLSADEWVYVTNTRENASNLRGYASVVSDNGIPMPCYVLLPDTCSTTVKDICKGGNECTLADLDAWHACVLPWTQYYKNGNNGGWESDKCGYYTSTLKTFLCVHNDWSTLHSKTENNGQNLMFVRLAHDYGAGYSK